MIGPGSHVVPPHIPVVQQILFPSQSESSLHSRNGSTSWHSSGSNTGVGGHLQVSNGIQSHIVYFTVINIILVVVLHDATEQKCLFALFHRLFAVQKLFVCI